MDDNQGNDGCAKFLVGAAINLTIIFFLGWFVGTVFITEWKLDAIERRVKALEGK